MAAKPGGNRGESLLLTCAGAAHRKPVANRAAVQLRRPGVDTLLCITAVTAEIPDKLVRTRNAKRRVLIDGCEDHCCRRVMERAGLPIEQCVVVADLTIASPPAEPDLINDAQQLVDHVQAA